MKTIDKCSTCKYFDSELWAEMDGDGDIPFCSWSVIDCTPNFGCIHWEPKNLGDTK